MKFTIPNMTCGGCARSVTQAILAVDPNAKVITDPPNRLVTVESSSAREKIEAALRANLFPAEEP
ncbi:heavy-metal-associated domain-containing protein [Massilia sp. YIM B04103]|uniref:heavy-metal-associated domain-containing protein n=1 Tax=Massilia sp. YIM B04103 TaxID=2963106 RepID=UPI00210B6B94|nr:heavy-metal-associated domain-containing protein [Massilia sp. YIM B04103]